MEKNLLIIGITDCEPCRELERDVKKDEIAEQLAAKHGVDASKVKVLYADVAGEEGNDARNICYSVDHFSSPLLVIEKKDGEKRRFCVLNDELEEESCGEFKKLPD